MKWNEQSKRAALLIFHLVWGLVLWFSISKYGLGVSTDSVHLLFGALNLSQGKGLFSFDGSFLLLWPPLYPMLLALIHLASGLDTFASAHVLQAGAYLGTSMCLSILCLKMFPDDFRLALAETVLADIGVVVLTSFTTVGSDYVFLFLIMLSLLLTGRYIESNSARTLLAMSAVGTLAMLERYLGIAVIATGVTAAFFLAGGSRWKRALRGLLLSLSALPALIWLAFTSGLINRRDPITLEENFRWFSKSILEWFFPAEAVESHLTLAIVLLWIFIIGLIILSFLWWRRQVSSPFVIPVFAFGLFYLLALFGSASVTYYNKLGGRFLLPLFLPFVTLLLVAVAGLPRAVQRSSVFVRRSITIGSMGGLAIVAVLLLQNTIPLVLKSHAGGAAGGENVFNTTGWHQNAALKYWQSHAPHGDYALFSNYPDAVAFYTRHACNSSPRKYGGPYGKKEFPVSQYADELFSSGSDVYLIWIEPIASAYLYGVQDLAPIARAEPLFLNRGGGVYRLHPSK